MINTYRADTDELNNKDKNNEDKDNEDKDSKDKDIDECARASTILVCPLLNMIYYADVAGMKPNMGTWNGLLNFRPIKNS